MKCAKYLTIILLVILTVGVVVNADLMKKSKNDYIANDVSGLQSDISIYNSRSIPPQTEFEVNSVSPPTTNANEFDAKMNSYENDEWEAYQSILSGDFSLINDEDCKSEMEFLYKMESLNEKRERQYILMDFNKDGNDELFIQQTPNHDSALFSYKDGSVWCIYIDDLEANCFIQPLKGGRLLEIYDYWIAPTMTIFELDSEFNWINQIQYFTITVDDFEYYKENYCEIIDQYPSITEDGVYYFQRIDGKVIELLKEDWERLQTDITEQIISDNEWESCSE